MHQRCRQIELQSTAGQLLRTILEETQYSWENAPLWMKCHKARFRARVSPTEEETALKSLARSTRLTLTFWVARERNTWARYRASDASTSSRLSIPTRSWRRPSYNRSRRQSLRVTCSTIGCCRYPSRPSCQCCACSPTEAPNTLPEPNTTTTNCTWRLTTSSTLTPRRERRRQAAALRKLA